MAFFLIFGFLVMEFLVDLQIINIVDWMKRYYTGQNALSIVNYELIAGLNQ